MKSESPGAPGNDADVTGKLLFSFSLFIPFFFTRSGAHSSSLPVVLSTTMWGILSWEILTGIWSHREPHGWAGIRIWILQIQLLHPNHYTSPYEVGHVSKWFQIGTIPEARITYQEHPEVSFMSCQPTLWSPQSSEWFVEAFDSQFRKTTSFMFLKTWRDFWRLLQAILRSAEAP